MNPDEFYVTLEGLPDSSKALRWQVYARQAHSALDAQAERIKALEGALRDTAMMLEHAITGRNGERYGFIETRSGSMMHAQGVVEKLRALLGEK